MARILLVEDDAALARGIAAVLRAKGHALDVVEDGDGALAAARDEPYALILLDLGLPDMDGIDVLRRLRRERNRTPVMVLTARDAVGDRVAGLDNGADDYVLKPFDPDEMEARVRALLRRAAGEVRAPSGRAAMESRLFICPDTPGRAAWASAISCRESRMMRPFLAQFDDETARAHCACNSA
jgi:two-component system response regulator TctD